MDKYRQFIEDMRRSRPQMPHPEEVTARIAEHTGAMPQDTTARPAPLRTGRIRLAAALTGIAAAASLVLTLSQALSSEGTEGMTDVCTISAAVAGRHTVAGRHSIDRYRELQVQARRYSAAKARTLKIYRHENIEN